MATGDDLRRLALALAGTQEAPHLDRAAFRVARIYATLAADERSAHFKLRPEEQDFICMMTPEAFAPVSGGWGRQGWTRAELSQLDEPRLAKALETAWAHALPKPKPSRRR
jgi:hypothetical protein